MVPLPQLRLQGYFVGKAVWRLWKNTQLQLGAEAKAAAEVKAAAEANLKAAKAVKATRKVKAVVKKGPKAK